MLPSRQILNHSPAISSNVEKSRNDSSHFNPIVNSKRQGCQCLGTSHAIINNCTCCGRIVCEAEKSGPCLTCTSLVCSKHEESLLMKDAKAGRELFGVKKLSFKNVSNLLLHGDEKTELDKAVEQTNRLIQFDRNAEKRTKIIDDERDYYNISPNKWMTAIEQESLGKKQQVCHKNQHAHQRSIQIEIDFSGRNIVEVQNPDITVVELLKDDTSIFNCPLTKDEFDSETYQPEYQEGVYPKLKFEKIETKQDTVRIQDKDIQFMSDKGMCLSVQQPYASLIISGIKYEGRNWYTSFRGKLWIHASSVVPLIEEISTVEEFYESLNGQKIAFPKSYPNGCILGCVDLVDCLSQDDYRLHYPTGECGASYVFILENPQELKVSVPMHGRRGIFKMEYNFHQAAKKILSKLGKNNV